MVTMSVQTLGWVVLGLLSWSGSVEGGFWDKKTYYETAPSPHYSAAPPPPVYYPPPRMDFRSLLEKECGCCSDGKEQCEARITAEFLQTRINEGDQEAVTEALRFSPSTAGVIGGLRIPPNFDFTGTKGKREKDPDVVVLKGLARALLDGLPTPRYEGDTHEPPPLPPGQLPDPWPMDPTNGKGLLMKLTTAVFVSGQTAPESTFTCQVTTTPIYDGKEFSVEQKQMCEANDPPEKEEEKGYYKDKRKSITLDRDVIMEQLGDRDVLQRIVDADPNEGLYKSYGSYGSGSGGQRGLKCSSCQNGNAYTCSVCWEPEFCSKTFPNCENATRADFQG